MRKHFSLLTFTIALLLVGGFASAQIVSSNLFLQGKYTEIGAQEDASFGTSVSAPSGYHPHGGSPPCGSSNVLAMVYDWGHDGWSTGSPNYMGDYTLPGSPWEEWDIETGGTVCFANSESCGPSGTLAGSFSSFYHSFGTLGPWYSNYGSRAIGIWTGSVGSGSGLTIRKEHRVDTFGSAVIVTTVLTNTTTSPITGVYYMRTCDPDNDESWSGGSFTTDNAIDYQNDYRHRVQVTAYATGSSSATGIPACPLALCTKDCRAKAVIFNYWPMSTSCDLADVWNETASCLGTSHYTVNNNTVVTGDIAIGLVFNLGDIPAHDSVIFSYAYNFNGRIDSAFPEPKMVINGVGYDSFALITACGTSLGDTLPVSILYGTDKCWSWSHWTWTASSAAGAAALLTDTGVVNGILVPSLTTTTTYTITGTQSMSDCAAKTFVITIVPSSLGLPGVADLFYCQGATAGALTASGANLMWYTTPTGGTGSTSAPTPSTTTPGTTSYYVTQNPCGVESSRARINVTITPSPVVNATNNGPICAGNTLMLFGNDTFTTGTIIYNWSGPGGFSSGLQNPTIASATTADSGVYIVSLTVNGCPSQPDTELAVVHFSPPAPATTDVTYCQYAATVPVIVTGSNLLWYTAASGGAGTPGIFTPSSATAGVFHYWFTQTLNGCESPRTELTVTINAKPAQPTPVIQTYCQFDTPSPLSASGSSLLWYGPGISGSTSAPTPTTTTPGVTYYYITQTILGCVSDSATDPVTVIAKPAAPVVADTTYCQNSSSAALTATGSGLSWYTTPSGGTALSTAPVPSTSIVGSTTWYVSQTVSGCESNRTPITATILYLPIFSIAESRPYVCQYDTLQFAYSGPSLTDPVYTWTMPTGATYVSGVPTDPSVIVRFDSLYMQNVILKTADYGGRCYTIDTLPVHVVYEPGAAATINTNHNLCLGDTLVVALTGHTDNASHYTWDFDGGTIITANSNSGGPYSVSWSDTGIHYIKVISYTTEGCPGIATIDTIDIHSLPDATILLPNLNGGGICLEDSLRLDARDSAHYENRYKWYPEHFFNNDDRNWIWGKMETAGYVSLVVTTPFGCVGIDSVLISPESCCTVSFPSAFTPNGDGKNDLFRPIFKGFHSFHEFRIENRWGETVFETSSSRMEWDGMFGGVPQDMGVYYYYLKYDCGGKTLEAKGEVTLIR